MENLVTFAEGFFPNIYNPRIFNENSMSEIRSITAEILLIFGLCGRVVRVVGGCGSVDGVVQNAKSFLCQTQLFRAKFVVELGF